MKRLILSILFLSSFYSCYKDSEYHPTNFNFEELLIKPIQLNKNQLLANGKDTLSIEFWLEAETDIDTEIELISDKGTFLETDGKSVLRIKPKYELIGDTIRVVARAKLVSGIKAGFANISAAIKEYKTSIIIPFQPNLPESMSSTPESVAIETSAIGEIEIATLAISSNGKVSDGIPISVRAIKASDQLEIGTFRTGNVKYTNDQIVTFHFTTMPDTIYSEDILIITSTAGAIDDTLRIFPY